MRSFTDSAGCLSDTAELLRRLQADGYLFIRGLLPTGTLTHVRLQFLEIARAAGWLSSGTRLDEGIANPGVFCAEPQPTYRNTYFRMYHSEAFHSIPHLPVLVTLFKRLLQADILLHPRIIGRVIFPHGIHRKTSPLGRIRIFHIFKDP